MNLYSDDFKFCIRRFHENNMHLHGNTHELGNWQRNLEAWQRGTRHTNPVDAHIDLFVPSMPLSDYLTGMKQCVQGRSLRLKAVCIKRPK